jgi:hypothetical protein
MDIDYIDIVKLNKILRSTLSFDDLDNTTKQHVRNIDSAMTTGESLVLYRGFNNIDSYFNEDLSSVITDQGYSSCSTDINIAASFTNGSCCIIKFFLPDDIKRIFKNKHDILLERNLQFQILNKKEVYRGIWVYIVVVSKFIPVHISSNVLEKTNELMETNKTSEDIRERIKKYGHSNEKTILTKIYEPITTFEELLETNIAFLQGEIGLTPYHLGPIASETQLILGNLIELNRKGFLSLEGQPGLCQYGEWIEKTWKDEYGKIAGNWFVDTEQKPYISGYLHKDLAEPLVKYLNSLKLVDKNRVYYNIFNFDNSFDKSNIKENINLTRDKSYKTVDKKPLSRWIWESNFRIENMSKYFDEFDGYNIQKELDKNYVKCFIIINKYCSKYNLEEILLDFFDQL